MDLAIATHRGGSPVHWAPSHNASSSCPNHQSRRPFPVPSRQNKPAAPTPSAKKLFSTLCSHLILSRNVAPFILLSHPVVKICPAIPSPPFRRERMV